MNQKLIVGGALALLLAASANASAYHIQNIAKPIGDPESWTGMVGVVAPADDPTSAICALLLTLPAPISTTVHDILCGPDHPGSLRHFQKGDVFGDVVCEQNDVSDLARGGLGLTDLALPGIGGLCYMSEGSDPGAGTCTTPGSGNEGRSTGFAPAYNGGACPNEARLTPDPLPVIKAPSRHWIEIQMWSASTSPGLTHAGHAVKFSAEIAGQKCHQPANTQVVYDEQYAYTVAQGHVMGITAEAPAAGDFGTYTVTPSAGPSGLSACIGPAPFYQ
jgi:hypothetical protein